MLIRYYFEKIYDEIRLQAEGGPQPNLNVGKIKETLIPVPPIEEQERIVARLDELMLFCDQMEKQFRDSGKLAERLAVSAVASLTGIAIEQEEEPMKAPQTELIAPLRLGVAPDIKAQAPLATILARHNGEMSAKDLWQRFGGEIDAFYAQLKIEVAHGWVLEPEVLRLYSNLDIDTIPSDLKPKAKLVNLIKNFGGSAYEKDLCERFGRGLDTFNAQLKIEVGYNWIVKSSVAEIKVFSEEREMA